MKKLSQKETKLVKMWDRNGYAVAEIAVQTIAWRNAKKIDKMKKLVRKAIAKKGEEE